MSTRKCVSPLLRFASAALLEAPPKQIALSGPAGFLGSRVLQSVLDAHEHRRDHGLEPGEVILLSSSPGHLMSRLYGRYGSKRMSTVRATRCDYYYQHDFDSWRDQLGSLGMGGPNAVFINLAALAGPRSDRPDAMMAVNYRAPIAAARACEALGFGHWVQSSTQAVKAERAGQVPYSRWKAMADYALARIDRLPTSVFTLGLLYSKEQGMVSQRGDNINMVDLALLPITPIMGNGRAPLQPLEVEDAASRIAYVSLTEPTRRPVQVSESSGYDWARPKIDSVRQYTWRAYDAVGPETMTMLELMEMFAKLNGRTLNPVFVDYRNFETVLNEASLGNLNRQFVSLLRSEQDAERPIVGVPDTFQTLLGADATLFRMHDGLAATDAFGNPETMKRRAFPVVATVKWVWQNYKVIVPGTNLVLETVGTYLFGKRFAIDENWRWIRIGAMGTLLSGVTVASVQAGAEFSKWYAEATGGGGFPPLPGVGF